MKFVFLYTEIAEYFLACCNQLAEHGEVHIIRWPVNKEAPFKFEINPGLKLYSKTDYTLPQLEQLVASIQPNVLTVSYTHLDVYKRQELVPVITEVFIKQELNL